MLINGIFINNEHFDEMMNIINEARVNPPPEGHKHHIIPRCWFKKKNIDVDNSDENLVLLSYEDHVKVHKLLYHCCKSKIMKSKMAYAYFRLTEGEIVENACFKGEKSPWYGKKHSAETKRKISEANKGKVRSDETRRKISESKTGENNPFFGKTGPNKGRVFSDETKRKKSVAMKGKSWKLVDGKRIYSKIKKYEQIVLI